MATQPVTPQTEVNLDPETMDIEALRELANTQPRDEQGRFTAPPQVDAAVPPQVDTAAPEPAQPEVDEYVYRRKIDLGDGSGVQVFEGASMEELVDKLADAQLHATRKIKELSAVRKEEKARTADEEFVLAQQLLESPSKTIRGLLEAELGESVETVKQKLAKAAAASAREEAEAAAVDFVQSQPEYHAIPANGVKIQKYLQTYKLDFTVENMQKAYEDLNASGLLAPKPQETSASGNEAEQATTRIATTVQTPVTPRRQSSGITARRSAPPVVKPAEPTEEELYSMPMEELERRARLAAR